MDVNITMIKVGAGERLDTTTMKGPIVGFVIDTKGLIPDFSLKVLNLQS